MIIRGIVVLAIIGFGIDTILVPDEEAAPKKVQRVKPVQKAQQAPKLDDESMDDVFNDLESDTDINKNSASKEIEVPEIEKEPEPIQIPTTTKSEPIEVPDTSIKNDSQTQVADDISFDDLNLDDELGDSTEVDNSNVAIKDSTLSDASEAIEDIVGDLEESTVKKEEVKKIELPDTPPDYELVGRGLVYNCKGRFWACVNKTAYFQCHRNQKKNLKENAPSECAIVSVYATATDCKKVQEYNINILKPTPFCN